MDRPDTDPPGPLDGRGASGTPVGRRTLRPPGPSPTPGCNGWPSSPSTMANDLARWSNPRPTSMATAPATSSWPSPAPPRSWPSRAGMGRCSGPTRQPSTVSAARIRSARTSSTRPSRRPLRPGGGTPQPAVKGGRVIGSPVLVQADGDGIPDLLALFFVFDDPTGTAFVFGADGNVTLFDKNHAGRRVIAAISGRTGRALWSRTLDKETMSRPWLWDRLNRGSGTPWPFDAFDSEVVVVPGRRGPIVAQVVGSQWTELDPATGKPHGRPIDFGFTPVRPVQHADLDGDGSPEVLASGTGKPKGTSINPDRPLDPRRASHSGLEPVCRLRIPAGIVPQRPPGRWLATSMAMAAPRSWCPTRASLAAASQESTRVCGCSRVADRARPRDGFDPCGPTCAGHRRPGPPDRRPRPRRRRHPRPRGGLALLRPEPRHLLRGGSPLDRTRVYVDALSGKDGHPLWWWHEDVTDYSVPRLWPPIWWGRGPDGWPMLVVPLGGKVPGEDDPSEPAVPTHAAGGPPPGSLDGPHAAHDRRPVLAPGSPISTATASRISGARSRASSGPSVPSRRRPGGALTDWSRPATSTATASPTP